MNYKFFQNLTCSSLLYWMGENQELSNQKMSQILAVNKSTYSKILNGKMYLKSDQIFLLQEHFKLNNSEESYLTYLADYEKTAYEKRRRSLQKKIEDLRKSKLSPKEALQKRVSFIDNNSQEFINYFQDPMNQIIHLGFSIEKFQIEPELLRKSLRLRKDYFNKILSFLLSSEYIIKQFFQTNSNSSHPFSSSTQRFKIIAHKASYHLPKSHPTYKLWAQLIRQEGQRKIGQEEEGPINLAISFTANKRTQEIIKKRILELLEEIKTEVEISPAKEIYQLTIDFFNYT